MKGSKSKVQGPRSKKGNAWTVGQLAELACLAEVMAPKAGNVHPGAGFEDVTWRDFVVSAIAIGPILEKAAKIGVGATVLACVEATRAAVGSNTNLGMILLLAPLCAVPRRTPLQAGIPRVLDGLTAADTKAVYAAIRLAAPGGLGKADRGDVRRAPTMGLVAAMGLAAQRDVVARQYVTDFEHVLDRVTPALVTEAQRLPLDQAIVRVHLTLMAYEPDTLIARKCGDAVAEAAGWRAEAVLSAGWPETAGGRRLFVTLDCWLRADGRRRNPGASADLIAAGLFAAMRAGEILPPWRWSS